MKDYYIILDIPPDANQEEILRAFEKNIASLSLGKSQKSADDIEEAYSVLSNPEVRSQYDHVYKISSGLFKNFDGLDISKIVQGAGLRPAQMEENEDVFFDFDDPAVISEVLEKMQAVVADLKKFSFGKKPAWDIAGKSDRNDNVYLDLKISVQESLAGGYKTINYTCRIKCSDCGGLGSRNGGELITCAVCLNDSRKAKRCLACAGLGKYPKDNCPKCKGQGRVTAVRKAEIMVPPKVKNGTILEVAQQGNFGFRNTLSGNLIVRIVVNS